MSAPPPDPLPALNTRSVRCVGYVLREGSLREENFHGGAEPPPRTPLGSRVSRSLKSRLRRLFACRLDYDFAHPLAKL